ncbi:SIR2 family protein [Stenotrophomonas sp. HITSZ_GD]|uniref:SIR2 family protein n=1 Tax=Stenotrophomonas sp. HITSZ_GD TaxID=3037248 RepID=UPI00240D4957|nr:SIR2 family protein [Stenotrophomonas sp. HITSZ_GD]MDG2524577.1 SIR2 family protein [Stenotrophomonas sp. HITSZ_GD]
MASKINIPDIYDKNVNFLIGSGASAGLFPTLSLQVRDDFGEKMTIESLATAFEAASDARYIPLFMYYYTRCVRPAQLYDPANVKSEDKIRVLDNYKTLLRTILTALQRRKPLDKRCNIFTTNYDSCFAHAADALIEESAIDFVLNDGARGFRRKTLNARNFNSFLCQTGIFDRTQSSIPQINLIHLHGSIYWKKEGTGIAVDYSNPATADLIDKQTMNSLTPFSTSLWDDGLTYSEIPTPKITQSKLENFWTTYKQLPIVNPTKWKFHETVFDEHYYQMLRLLSYELEKPNSILITFGFSFADEHILHLVERSLSNPSLQLFVCCYDSAQYERVQKTFRAFKNVTCIQPGASNINFDEFNRTVFTLESTLPDSAPTPGGDTP